MLGSKRSCVDDHSPRAGARDPTGTVTRATLTLTLASLLASPGCATVPLPPPEPTFEEKLAWILRLEDHRVLRDPTPPPVPPAPAGQRLVVPPRPVPDLIGLLADDEARVRRRAALAVGRVGLAAGIEPLSRLLADGEPEVRQMAAFALGLIGDAAAVPALVEALGDPVPIVQGRAAEALGQIGAADQAPVIAAMARPRVGLISGLAPDDLTYPMAPEVESVRLALFALARLKAYEPLASVVLDAASGRPLSRWWPVAYALRRVEDPRATVALRELLGAEGRFTRGFAARGLGVLKVADAVPELARLAADVAREPAVAVEAVRALTEIRAPAAVPALVQLLKTPNVHPGIRAEAVTAIGRSGTAADAVMLLDLLDDRAPQVRAATFGAIAALDAESFLLALSGLDRDPEWRVRAAVATALGTLSGEQAASLLQPSLDDEDPRVRQAALRALAVAKAPGADTLLLAALSAEDPEVRRAAVESLADLQATGAVAQLRAAYEAAKDDPVSDTRAAILAALARIDPAAATPVLGAALQDREWAVRMRAAALLAEIDPDRPTAEAMRPAPTRLDGQVYGAPGIISPRYSTHVYVDTDRGTIQIELAVLDAPLTVHNFVGLARQGYFDGAPVHRVVPAFVVQDGDPTGGGAGGPGWTIRDEINQRPYLRGTVGMALAGRDSGGSQFFITHGPQPHLDGRYTVFGQVIAGMEVVDQIAQGDVIRSVRVWDGS
jgi:cyclophilin family peptidyl-prolyl cis-trans isomerase/HEAT repeat protein